MKLTSDQNQRSRCDFLERLLFDHFANSGRCDLYIARARFDDRLRAQVIRFTVSLVQNPEIVANFHVKANGKRPSRCKTYAYMCTQIHQRSNVVSVP